MLYELYAPFWVSYLMKGYDAAMADSSKKTAQQKEYSKKVKKASPNSPVALNCVKAFFSGGIICLIGQLLRTLYTNLGMKEDTVKILVSVTLIAVTAALTGLGVFDKIAKHAGAGTLVPITGFANAVAAPAIEFQTEGRIVGTGAKMFIIAGPVIVYGCSTAFVYGVIYYCFCGGA